ncbi:MAG: hypothetical protein Q4C49_11060, partial [Bacillota bacterium]|nr:hypothetical protein [Bacillota bacterium]
SLEEVVEETIVVENENTNQEMKEVALQSALSKLELTMEDVQDTSVSDEPDGSYTVRFWVNELGKGVSVSTDSQGQYVSLREG